VSSAQFGRGEKRAFMREFNLDRRVIIKMDLGRSEVAAASS